MTLRSTTPTLLLAAAPALALAQVTLGAETLPEAGDRFETVVDTSYADAGGNVTRAGADQTWVFGDIEAESATCTLFRAAGEGDAGEDFADAALVVTTGTRCDGDDPEAYLARVADGLDVVGLGAGLGADVDLPVIRLGTPVPYQRAPFTFGAGAEVVTTERFTFAGAILQELTDDPELLAALSLVDSVRVGLAIEAAVVADGWGRAGESADALSEVLRVRRTTDVSQVVEVRVPVLGYVDIATLSGVDPALLPPLVQSVVSYEWWSPGEAAPLYRVTVDSAGAILSAERSTTVVTGVSEVAGGEDAVDVRLRGGQVTLTRLGVADERLAARVYDAAGATRAVLALAPGQASAEVSAEGWPAGLYVVEVRGERGGLEAHRCVVW